MTDRDLDDIDLTATDWAGVDWTERDLSGLNLTGIDLTDATLRDADLSRANITGATLDGADLTDATLRQANLTGASLVRATLRDTHLVGANFTDAVVVGADLSGAKCKRVNLVGVRGAGLDLSETAIERGQLANANLGGADLSGTLFRSVNAYDVHFGGTDLSGATLTGDFQRADFVRAALTDATLECTLDDAHLAHADLSGVTVDDPANLAAASSLEGAIVPTEYDTPEPAARPDGPVHTVDVPAGPASEPIETDHETGPEAVELLSEHYDVDEDDIEGCFEEEVRHVERACDVVLPAAYRSMLKHMGRRADGFMEGAEFYYEAPGPLIDLVHRTDGARRHCEQHDPEAMSFGEDDFVFLAQQGPAFEYFDTGVDDPDPPVYSYEELTVHGEQSAESFSAWLFDRIEN